MLLATPFLHHIDNMLPKDGEPPRVISEVKKSQIGGIFGEQNRPRLSGDLFVSFGNEKQWWPRRVTIRGGQLHVGSIQGETKYGGSVKIPLRRLSLSAGKLPNSLSLIKGQNIMLTIQTPNEKTFDLWVKSIAVELIRQTPLEDVKYFDILTIPNNLKATVCENTRDWNFNCITKSPAQSEDQKCCTSQVPATTPPSYGVQTKYSTTEAPSRHKRTTSAIRNGSNYSSQRSQVYQRSSERVTLRARSRSCNSVTKEDINSNYIANNSKPVVSFDEIDSHREDLSEVDENSIEILFKKCQNHESYVPVKEKLLLFETLCRLGRKVRSAEDVHLRVDSMGAKRARSLHDLNSVHSAGVRQICRYFEDKCESHKGGGDGCTAAQNAKDKRLIHSDSHLNSMRKVKCVKYT